MGKREQFEKKLNPTIHIFFLLAFAIVLAACNSPSAQVAATPAPPTASPVVATPTPVSPGMVTGRLRANDPVSLQGLSLFLGSLVKVGEQHGAFLDRQQAPVARLDEASGKFVFADVPPGQYSFILAIPERGSRAFLAPSGDVQVIQVISGKTTDLGDVSIDQ